MCISESIRKGGLLALALILTPSLVWAGSQRTSRQLTDEQEAFVSNAVNAKYLVEVNHDDLLGEEGVGEPLYRATENYYRQFEYLWHPERLVTADDKEGVDGVRKSNLTDRATNKFQIWALLKEVYTNPLIPGYRRDISNVDNYEEVCPYVLNSKGGMNTGASAIYETFEENGVTYVKIKNGEPVIHTKKVEQTTNKEGHTETRFLYRKDFQYIDYPACNFYPYDTGEEVKIPINGATALIVELTDDYHFLNSDGSYNTNSPCGSFSEFASRHSDPRDCRKDFMDAIFKYVKAVTVMTKQYYVQKKDTDNPGFLFNTAGSYSKCFLMTKGCNRAYKSYQRLGSDLEPIRFFAGEPFYSMFEEYSPNNKGPMEGAFYQMNEGKAFPVDHNCGTSIQQQHDIIFAKDLEDYSYFNVNLMLFVPDKRFDGPSRTRISDQSLTDPSPSDLSGVDRIPASAFKFTNNSYSPYSFYAKDHQPYIYFNKIQAAISSTDFIDVVIDQNDNSTISANATVPISWVTQYNKIVGHEAKQTYKIHRVVEGNMQEEHISADSIIIDDKYKDIFTLNEDGTIVSQKDEIFVTVLEKLVDTSEGVERRGNEVSYVITGKRDGSGDLLDVQSNIVKTHLPGNDLTIRLAQAYSIGHYDQHQNHYTNKIELYYNGYNTEGGFKEIAAGNYFCNDFLAPTDAVNSPDVIDMLKNVELHVYRHRPNTEDDAGVDNEYLKLVGKFKYGKGQTAPQYMYGATWAVVVINMDAYKVEFDDNGNMVETLIELKDKDGNYIPAFQGKIDLLKYPETNEKYTLHPLDNHDDLFGSFTDEFFSVMEAENVATRFRYYVGLVDVDTSIGPRAVAAQDVNKTAIEITPSKLSNYSNVFVPKRDIIAGFVPYNSQQVAEDIHGELERNRRGVAIYVMNNPSVSGYEIYHHSHGKVARIDRYNDGSFEASYYDPASNRDKRNRDNAILQSKTSSNYVGVVSIELPEEFLEDESNHYSAEIQYYNDGSEYSGNTYIMPQAKAPEWPTLSIKNITLNDGYPKKQADGQFEYNCDVLFEVKNASMFSFDESNFAIWHTHESSDIENSKRTILAHPGWSTASYAMPAKVLSVAEDDNEGDNGTKTATVNITFTHPSQATESSFIWFHENARLYAQLPVEYSMADDAYTNDGFVVLDTGRDIGMYAAGKGLSGIENVSLDTEDAEFYTLQGVRINPANAAPGVYIRRTGNTCEKVHIN